MNLTALACIALSAVSAGSSLTGRVIDADGDPIANARVFAEHGASAERGADAPLVECRTDAKGNFTFDSIEPGLVGVFAYAEAHAFGGLSIRMRVAEDVSGLTIRLQEPDVVGGRVLGPDGAPVANAEISPVLFLQDAKVGIPMAKLRALGVTECLTDRNGAFTLQFLPKEALVALKVTHPLYAQEALSAIEVGRQDLHVQLDNGVVVEGTVLSRDSGSPVANTPIIIANPRPPRDALIVRTKHDGKFLARLKPGKYLCQAASAELRSPGWEEIAVTGRQATQRMTLYVSGTSALEGNVKDAMTGEPIENVKLTLTSQGRMAAVATTGPSGEYAFEVAEGLNTVVIRPVPGYMLPERSSQQVTALQGKAAEVPTFWLVPIPTFHVTVTGVDGAPAKGAAVTVVRPTQYRWRLTDEEGKTTVNVTSVPAGGRVLALAEHPDEPVGALFSLDPRKPDEVRVQMFPFASIKGEVTNRRGKEFEGAVVAGLWQDDSMAEPFPLWRTVSRRNGAFVWNTVIPALQMTCVAYADEEHFAKSMPVKAEFESITDVGRIVIDDAKDGKSLYGRSLDWYERPVQSGLLPPAGVCKDKPAVIMFCTPEETPLALEGLTVAEEVVRAWWARQGAGGDPGGPVLFALVVDGDAPVTSESIPILRGKAPGVATTYLTAPDKGVVLETLGMPPCSAVTRLALGYEI